MKKLVVLYLGLIFYITLYSQTYRDSINVLNYNIKISVKSLNNKQIYGETRIKALAVFNKTKTLKLGLYQLDIDNVSVSGKKLKSWTYNNEIIKLNFSENLSPEDTIIIKVKYHGHPKQDPFWGGFYFYNRDFFNYGVAMDLVPHSFGRCWFPANDKFSDKATYNFEVNVPSNLSVACGGTLTKIKKNKNTTTWYYSLNKPISTYLASLAISKYDILHDTINGLTRKIPVSIYSWTDRTKYTKQSLKNLGNAVKIYENLFGAYPWDRIGYVEVSFNGGAMEHVENIAIPATTLNGTLDNESLFYHELAHSWFGNLVTCSSAKDMWLNESWAEYASLLFFEKQYGEQVFKTHNRYRQFYAINTAHQADGGYKALVPMDLNNTYGKTIYKKGPGIIHTLKFQLGDSLFFNCIKNYLNEFAFSNATTKDLKKSFEKTSGLNLNDFFNFWIYSPGFPFFFIKDFSVIPQNGKYIANVAVKQKDKQTNGNYAKNTKIDIVFLDSSMQFHKYNVLLKDTAQNFKFSLPFNPTLVMIDPDEKLADATVDEYHFLTDTGLYVYDTEFAEVYANKLVDSAFVRITINFINTKENQKYYLQKNYFWTVQSYANNDFNAKLRLYATTLMDFNFTKLFNLNKFVVLYRNTPNDEWIEIPSLREKNYLEVQLKNGDYIFAVKK